jgi:hypothetical protein
VNDKEKYIIDKLAAARDSGKEKITFDFNDIMMSLAVSVTYDQLESIVTRLTKSLSGRVFKCSQDVMGKVSFIIEWGAYKALIPIKSKITCHILKCWPKYFEQVFQGDKNYEVRRNDRDFKKGDIIILREYNNDSQEFTGREVPVTITNITHGGNFGIDKDFCVLGIEPLGRKRYWVK